MTRLAALRSRQYKRHAWVIGATPVGLAAADLLREHHVQVDLIEPRPLSDFRSLVRKLRRQAVGEFFGGKKPSGTPLLIVRCDGGKPKSGEIGPEKLAECWPDCPFTRALMERQKEFASVNLIRDQPEES